MKQKFFGFHFHPMRRSFLLHTAHFGFFIIIPSYPASIAILLYSLNLSLSAISIHVLVWHKPYFDNVWKAIPMFCNSDNASCLFSWVIPQYPFLKSCNGIISKPQILNYSYYILFLLFVSLKSENLCQQFLHQYYWTGQFMQ